MKSVVIPPASFHRFLPSSRGVQFIWASLCCLVSLFISAPQASAQSPVKVNFESRKISITGQAASTTWQSVTFTRNFNGLVPVVIMGPAYSVDGHPHTIRVRSVTATGFQWQVDEWDYLTGAHPGNITVHFYAMSEGTHVFGSQRWQVGKVNVNRSNVTVPITGFTTPPQIFTQVLSTNNNIAANNPRALKSRNSLVTAANFAVNLETQQSFTTAIVDESVGYIAVSEGIGYLDGKVVWAYSPGTVGHTVKTFYAGPFTNPVILAQTQTKNDIEPGDLRLSSVPSLVTGSTRIQLRFQEETSANADLTHAAETVAGLFIGDMSGEAQAKLVYANTTITQAGAGNWTKVNLGAAYTSPIVVFGPLTRADGTPAHIRVRNVLNVDPANTNRASFEYQVDEWDFTDGVHGAENVSYMVIEEGVHAIGGQVVQAASIVGVTETGSTQYVSDTFWASDVYFEREPAIFAQCVSTDEPSAAVARVDAVDTLFDYPMNFRVRLTEAENADQTHAAEVVHYIVMPGGTGQFMSSNTNFRFSAGVTNTLSSTSSAVSFPAKYAKPSIFSAAQGDLAATLANDGYHQTTVAADLDPISLRQSALDAAGLSLLAEEDGSGTTDNIHSAEVGAWLVFQGEADADGDGVTDAIETQMGTSLTLATSTNNASGGTANDFETLKSLYSLSLNVSAAAGYERVDKTVPSPVSSAAVVQVSRSYGSMQLTLRALLENGGADLTKANPVAGDYTTTGLSGSNLVIAAGAGITGSPVSVSINPVQDAVAEVPEYLKLTFGPTPQGANPQITSVTGTVSIRDADPSLTQNRSLYVAYLARGPGVISTGSGIAVALLEGDNDQAKVSTDLSGLSSLQNTTYLRMNNDQDVRNNLGVGNVSNVVWFIRAAATATTDQAMLGALDAGQIYCDINTVNYTSGEILGYFNKAEGGAEFDPNRADLVEPALPGSLTAAEVDRDIHRFLDQSTFGATTELYDAVKTEILVFDSNLADGVSSANLRSGYSAWLNKQMDLGQTPSPNFLTLVMAADNEEFLLRNSKPLFAGNDQQFAGNGFSATYDTFGNVTNPYQVGSNNIASFNSPNGAGNGGANRRREWWTLVLQSRDQVRQRMAAALHEILIISENDTTVGSRNYGAANYWDMMAQGAFGKYRDLLEKVSYSPMMGIYLSHLRNRAQYSSGGVDIFPDENYAREIMQLFTIGLVLKHPDGGLVLSPSTGLPIPTYDQTDITELARVLTGLCHGARHATVNVSRNSGNGYVNVPTTAQAGQQIEFQGVNFTDFSSGAGEAFYQAPWIYPMKALGRFSGITYHDFGAKRLLHLYNDPDGAGPLLGGTLVPAQDISALTDLQTHPLADVDIRLAHNALAGDPTSGTYNGHQNTPVFITRQLIQRLVTSNPSPGYLYRASEVYRDTNGNLGEVMKAILLDYEARSLAVADTIASAGKLKEPLVQYASFLRALKPSSGAPVSTLSSMTLNFSGADSPMLTSYPSSELNKFPAGATRLRFNDQTSVIGQSPQKAPSVFNWFLPDYVQPGLMASNGLYGPELQINTESMLVNRVNRHYALAWMGLTGGFPGFGLDDFTTNSANMTPQLLTSGGGSVNPNSGVMTLTFDSTNWNVAQTVTVFGLENGIADGNRSTSILHTVASGDTNFSGSYTPPLNFTVADNEIAEAHLVAITQTGPGTTVTEGAGGTDTYKIVLTAAPTGNVTITPSAVLPWQLDSAVSTSDISFSPATVVFTTANWNVAQFVTVTANDDAVANSFLVASAPLNVRTATIRHSVSSADPDYAGCQTSDFNCAITDNDTASVRRFVPTKASASGINIVTEGSTTDTYTVAFATGAAPTANVTLTLTYDATRLNLSSTDGTFTNAAGTATLTFTSANYTTARTLTVSAVDDATRQGIQFRSISHTLTSTDTSYNGLACAPAYVRLNDNDSAATNGISVVHTWGITQAVEGGMTDTYLVALNKAPTGTVTLTWTGNDGDVGGIGNLTFTTANWWVPQTVTVTPRNDLRVETTHVSQVRYTPSGGGYASAEFTILDTTIGDDDLNSAAGISLVQSAGTTAIAEGGATDTLDYRLTGAPNNDVVISLSANAQYSLSATSLTFTPQNWSTVQSVTVTAVNDTVAEATQNVVLTSTVASTDVRYNAYAVTDVSIAVTDNDNTSRIVLAVTGAGNEVTEGGATDTLNVSLTGPTAPTANVVVNFTANAQLSYTPATLTFTPANWTTAQSVTITAVNDATVEAPLADTITATTDAAQPAGFLSLSTSSPISILDNEEVNNNGAIQVLVTNGFTRVIEGGMTDTIEVSLRRAPTADVTLTPTIVGAGQLNLSPANLTFTAANWFLPQTVSVSAADDATVEGAHSATVTYAASATGGYITIDTSTAATVSIGDNELTQPAVLITPVTGSVTEGGATLAYSISLNAAPNAGATVRVTPTAYLNNATNTTQLSFSPAFVDFTTANFATAQNITITAVDDVVGDATLSMTVTNSASVPTGTDTRYNGHVGPDVSLTVSDNDTAVGRIVITETSGTVLAEDAGTDTITIALAGPAPSADVTVNLARAGSQFRFLVGGSSLDTQALTFTPANYTTAQTVTLISIGDTGSEGVHTDTLNATAASTAPANYTSLTTTLPVRILDSDDLGRTLITVTQSGGSTRVVEGGTTDTYTVVLRRAPTANVTLSGNYNPTQLSLSPQDLTFTPTNWNVPQTVTVTAVDDSELENAHLVSVTYISSHTGGYLPTDTLALNPQISVGDNETVGTAMITATESGGFTWLAETRQPTDTYTLVLGSQPTANVTITPQAWNNLGGTNLVTFTPTSVTFTPANWSSAQTVTVNLNASANNNGTRAAFIGHVVNTTDAAYASYPPPSVNAIISDANETTATIGIIATGAGTTVYEGAAGNSDSVYVFMRKPVTADVTVTPSFSSAGQVTFSSPTLTFTTTNWNIPQILTISAVNDSTVEASLTGTLTCTPSATGGYVATNVGTHSVIVNDNDATGQLILTQGSSAIQEGGTGSYTVRLSSQPAVGQTVTVTIVSEKHVVPTSSHAIQAGYYAASATGSNQQKDNMQFNWAELTGIYTAAYTASIGVGPETTSNSPAAHMAGTKALIDKLDLLWGGGRMKARWPDGASTTDNQRDVIIQAIYNCYATNRLTTDTTNFPLEVRERCRFAAHLVSIAPGAIVSH
jgi:Protein of unknown function (DUF1800)